VKKQHQFSPKASKYGATIGMLIYLSQCFK